MKRLPCLLLLSLLPLAACGDDGGDDGGDDHDAAVTIDGAPDQPDADPGSPDAAPPDAEVPSNVVSVDCNGADIAEEVTTSGNAFVNGNITIQEGDIVRFSTGGNHNMASPGNAPPEKRFSSGTPGSEGCLRFDVADDYPFICQVHPSMTGTVTVE